MGTLVKFAQETPNDEAGYLSVRNQLRERYENRPLVFGYVGYPPFVSRNGKASGYICEGLKEIVKTELQAECEEVPLSWADAFCNLGLEQPCNNVCSNGDEQRQPIDVIIDPVIMTYNRSVSIVPYARIRCNTLLFRRSYEHEINVHRKIIKDILNNLHIGEDWFDVLEGIKKEMHSLSNLGLGFGVTAGVFEHDLLKFFHFPSTKLSIFEGTDIAANAENAMRTNKCAMVLLDYASCKAAKEALGGSKKGYEMADLFGVPIWTDAGFAIHPEDQDLIKFLSFHCNGSQIFKECLSEVDKKKLKDRGLCIIEPGDICKQAVPFSFVPLWAFSIVRQVASIPKTGTEAEPQFLPKNELTTSAAWMWLSINDVGHYVALPLMSLSCIALLTGLFIFKASTLGLLLSVCGGVLGYESFLLWHNCRNQLKGGAKK